MSAPIAKSYTSAVCVVPPRKLWDKIQSMRCFNDRNFVRWPPHINLLYPFVIDKKDILETTAHQAAQKLAEIEPFQLTLEEVSHFKHRGSCTILLSCKNNNLLSLQAALQTAFPEFNDILLDPHGNFRGFNPHLSIGQCSHQDLEKKLTDIEREFEPLSFKVDSVEFISREGPADKPFKFRHCIGLGSARSPEEINAPYVATVGPQRDSQNPRAVRYGIGAEQEGVWYFAYGANMSKKKLTGARGITPIESVNVQLPGWSLSFNHRGAMGNIVKLKEGEKGEGGFTTAHGVAHRIGANDLAILTQMEHEYRPTEVELHRADGAGQIKAVAFVSPKSRSLAGSLPPTIRYAELLRSGADDAGLDPVFRKWLQSIPTVPSERKRGDEYWTGVDGNYMKVAPRLWNGSEKQKHGRSKGRGKRGQSTPQGAPPSSKAPGLGSGSSRSRHAQYSAAR